MDECPLGPCEHFKCEDCRYFVDVVIRAGDAENEELRAALKDAIDMLEGQQAMPDDSIRRKYEHLFN